MNPVVIDTNVAVVANGDAPQASADCVLSCIDALDEAIDDGLILVDDGMRILDEYRRKLSLGGQPGPGDRFMKWLWNNRANPLRCRSIAITARPGVREDFEEFPDDPEFAAFDPSDRKFVAVALASGLGPPILNAADTDWWPLREAFARVGVTIEFLCIELMREAGRS